MQNYLKIQAFSSLLYDFSLASNGWRYGQKGIAGDFP
jgi:hypothetical protein